MARYSPPNSIDSSTRYVIMLSTSTDRPVGVDTSISCTEIGNTEMGSMPRARNRSCAISMP